MKGKFDPKEMAGLLEYMEGFDTDRNKRWVDVSQMLAPYENWMMVTAQGLGKLDAKLIREDEYILENGKASHPVGDLGDHLTLSYLWVLGAYELVRTLDQRMREAVVASSESASREKVQKLKWRFERIRVPLAKFEASRKHSNTDSSVAHPGVNTEQGIAWQVAADKWITRRKLSDAFLETCEQLQA